jgi:hypothetical protein
MAESKTSERRLEAKQRQVIALEMRKAGASFPEIARELGYRGPSGAFNAVNNAIRDWVAPAAEEVFELEAQRLDRLMLSYWQKALDGEHKSAELVLKIMDRRAKLLGLDAPQRIDVTTMVKQWARANDYPEDAALAMAEEIIKEAGF